MNEHQKVSWQVCSVIGALAAVLYTIIAITIICINIAGACGLQIPQWELQFADFWAYFPRILLSVSMIVCYGLRWRLEKAGNDEGDISFRLMITGIFALALTFIELTQ